MTINDLRRKIENNPTIFGAASYCVHCGYNLMCAPRESFEPSQIKTTWKHCFAECRSCGIKNPPVSVDTFTLEEWRNGTWTKGRKKGRK